MTTIVQNICKVFEIPVPDSEAQTMKVLRQASRAPEAVFAKFSQEAQNYLEGIKDAVKRNKGFALPSVEEFVDDSTESEDEVSSIIIPPGIEPHITRSNYPIETLISKWNRRDIRAPRFQREFVWPEPRQQGLIDTILAGFVVPEIMLAAESPKEVRSCLDGWQRLSTIMAFFNNELKISKKAGGFTEFGGLTFSELPKDLQDRFLRYELGITDVLTSRQYWAPIFGRLNGGGLKLTPMELRRGIFEDTNAQPLLDVLEEISKYDEMFLALYGVNNRYAGLQALLRAVAMHNSYQNYTKPMDQFLNNYCASLQRFPKKRLEQLSKDIYLLLTMMYASLGKVAFRLEPGAQVNAGLIDCMFHGGFLMLKSDLEELNDVEVCGKMFVNLRERLLKSANADYALRHDTSGKASVTERMEATEDIVGKMLQYREKKAERMLIKAS